MTVMEASLRGMAKLSHFKILKENKNHFSIMDINSARVDGSFRKLPSIKFVTIETPGF